MSHCKALIGLGYTADDTGVRAVCDNILSNGEFCGFAKNLGWMATIKDVYEAQREHDMRDLP